MNALRNSLRILMGKRPPALQVAALCRDPVDGKVLLITSRGTGRWIIPKGWPMEGRSLTGAAAREAWEEAGVEGRIVHDPVGRYRYQKDQDSGFAIDVDVRVFLLYVTATRSDFPEADERERRWFSPQEAAERVAEPGLRALFLSLPDIAGAQAAATVDSADDKAR